jgi:hypothetical protein
VGRALQDGLGRRVQPAGHEESVTGLILTQRNDRSGPRVSIDGPWLNARLAQAELHVAELERGYLWGRRQWDLLEHPGLARHWRLTRGSRRQ